MLPTPSVEITKGWRDALLGFKFSLQSQHRSDGTIANRTCSARIMAKHAIAAGLDDPIAVDYGWLATYMSAQYAARKRGGPAVLYADLRAFWTWYCAEFGADSPGEKVRRPRDVMTDVLVLTDVHGRPVSSARAAPPSRALQPKDPGAT